MVGAEERGRPISFSQLYVDVGAKDADAARQLGVQVGDRIVPEGTFRRMSDPNRMISKAWDDRVGCALIVETIEALLKQKHPNTIYAAWTTEEEMGRANATVDLPGIHPDLVIVVEVGITLDTPDATPGSTQEVLGGGPALDMYDGALVTTPTLRDWIDRQARQAGIPLQFTTLWQPTGGASTSTSFLFTAPSTAILVPFRYAHTPNGVIDLNDYRRTRELLLRLLTFFDEDTWRGIIGQR